MQTHSLVHSSHLPRHSPGSRFLSKSLMFFKNKPFPLSTPNSHVSILNPKYGQVSLKTRLLAGCMSSGQELTASTTNDCGVTSVSYFKEGDKEDVEEEMKMEASSGGLENASLWEQMKDIVTFTGPALGLWLCGPLMSLIDTAVIGQGSSIELAALGPGTVLCDSTCYIFMFLAISTSNMIANSLAKQDKDAVQHQISILLFIGLTCGFFMLLLTKFFGRSALAAFIGPNNSHLVPIANSYVQIRGVAWPAILIGWVAQSASLGMKDSWGPLKALIVASVINGIGDIVLCRFLNYGIAGAAWATMVSQVVAGYMMIDSLNKKGYSGYAISVPSFADLMTIFRIAAPVFIVMMSKVTFYALIVYFAASMGTLTLAAHQVMVQVFFMCTVWGEPLCQTAQSFMPELIDGKNRSLVKAQMLMKSLTIIGAIFGLMLGIVGTAIPSLFPNIFTTDQNVIQEMRKVVIPYFCSLTITPCILSLEGTLLAGQDLKFISLSMSGCFALGALLLLLVSSRGYGLPGCWYTLVVFQWTRFFLSLQRILSPNSMLFSEDYGKRMFQKLKAE
ncbi:hypothetical protein K2173_013525 [Erythroxylum novogranatense]|uniref:Protein DETOXIFICATION n=1 Tax=Erythroxylum novogranatense TaxID=1862640 RepID=A0AAV8TK65_9ROSI|nr:hypothetical protein K2173_013525 [Erythroxylum novogranatense]